MLLGVVSPLMYRVEHRFSGAMKARRAVGFSPLR
jgi:hypothetical protein